MISRQIGATLAARQRAGVGCLQAVDDLRPRAPGGTPAEPSARFSSPTCSATAARRFSSPSSSRSTASICARRRQVGRRRATRQQPCGELLARPRRAARRRCRTRWRRATPRMTRIRPSSACSFGSSTERSSAISFCAKRPAHLGPSCWYFLLIGDSSQASSCLQLVFGELLLEHRADGRRRELHRPLARRAGRPRRRTCGPRPRSPCPLPRASRERRLLLQREARPPASSALPGARRCCARTPRCRLAAARGACWTSSFFAGCSLRCRAGAGEQCQPEQRRRSPSSCAVSGCRVVLARRCVRRLVDAAFAVPLPLPSRSLPPRRHRRSVVLDDALQARSACVPSSSAISVTPCVARPISRISATRVRISTPPVGDQHDLVVGSHQRGGDDLAVALATAGSRSCPWCRGRGACTR